MKKQTLTFAILATTAFACAAASAEAAVVNVSGTAEVTTVASGHSSTFAVGDDFDFAFTYNDSIADTQAGTTGVFNPARTAISLSRHISNTGTWNPALGTFTNPGSIVTFDSGTDNFTVNAGGSGFPTSNGENFFSISLHFPSGTNYVNDTGTGQTLAAVLGGPLPGNVSIYNIITTELRINFFDVEDDDDAARAFANLTALTVSVVPEPSGLALAGLAAAAFGWFRRKRG